MTPYRCSMTIGDIFVELGIRQHFDIPKFHFTGHYRFFLEMYGTADNFNTENTERLHIDMAKNAYAASNRKERISANDSLAQPPGEKSASMTNTFADGWRVWPPGSGSRLEKPLPSLVRKRRLHMTKHPTIRAVPLTKLRSDYHASSFTEALLKICGSVSAIPMPPPAYIKALAPTIHIPAYSFPVYSSPQVCKLRRLPGETTFGICS